MKRPELLTLFGTKAYYLNLNSMGLETMLLVVRPPVGIPVIYMKEAIESL